MLKAIGKIIVIVTMLCTILSAGEFDVQAEKDRLAMQHYFLTKFSDPLGKSASYFPYVDPEEIKKDYIYPVKLEDFAHGTAAWYKPTKEQLSEINDFPPYDIALDEGKALFQKKFANGKSYSDCFPNPAVKNMYPLFDTRKNEVVTLGQAVNQCRIENGEKPLKYGKDDIAKIMAYMAFMSRGKEIAIKIPSKEAMEAYNDGKKEFYKQRGYFALNCAECHVAGSGQRIRAEALSPTIGDVTHFPVYRLKWGAFGTLQRRLQGCIEDTGSLAPQLQSKELRNLEYFLTYMSNGFKIDGPDTRK